MRKVFASMTAVSMAAAVMLAGCGSNSSDKKTTTAASTKATEAATEKKTEAATEKKTEAATEKETEKVSSEEASSEEVSSEKASSEEASSEAASKETEAKADENAKVRVIDIDLTSEQYAFGVNKEQPELLEKTNEFIAKIMEDGTLMRSAIITLAMESRLW